MAEPEWDCEAYGPDGRGFGALCFLSGELGKRKCVSKAECAGAMGGQRRRVFRRIQELAAAGDPVGVDLAETFTDPEQLLGGSGEERGDG
jgi:hypothetical protein